MNWPSDRSLVTAARSGDQQAAGRLLERHGPAAWRAAYAVCRDHAIADDALQDGSIRAMRYLDSFDPTRPFSRWFQAIVIKRALTLLANRAKRNEDPLDSAVDLAADAPDPADLELPPVLRRLPVRQRQVVIMYEVLGFSTDEIATMMELPSGTVRSHLTRGRGKLRELMESSDPH